MSRACSDEWLRANEGEKGYDDESECGGEQEGWSNYPMGVFVDMRGKYRMVPAVAAVCGTIRLGSKTWGFATL